MNDIFNQSEFPLSAAYNPDWIKASVSGGANPLILTEWLSQAMELKPKMRVLDLGCGRAMSSIFLHREFGVQVWAVDLWFSVTENLQRIRDAGVVENVFPIHADARLLPFGAEFFDAIISIDSYIYYGTDDLFLNSLARFIKPGGQIGIVGSGLMQEIKDGVPHHLQEWWTPELWCLHSADWWRNKWERTGIMDIEISDTMPEGWRQWRDWHLTIAPDNLTEIQALEADKGTYLGYVRQVGRRKPNIQLLEPLISVPTLYTKMPLTRKSY